MKPYHRNPRQISKKSFNELKASLEKLGDLGGIVHNLRTDEIIGGNQRENVFGQAQEIVLVETFDKPDKQGTVAHGFVIWNGAKYSYRQVDWDEATSSEANIRANLTGGTWDFDVFANQWGDAPLIEWGMDTDLLQDWGRDYAALSDMLASEEEPMEEGDAEPQTNRAEELRELWGVETGQMWRLPSRVEGQEHRLICGDCTDEAVVERVMGGEKAALAPVDPPYNVGFDYDGETVDDDKAADKYEKFSRDWFDVCQSSSDKQIVTPGGINEHLWDRWFNRKHKGAWIKLNAMTRGRVSNSWCWEPVYFFGQKFGTKRANDVFNYGISNQQDTGGHPCPKPLKMWIDLLENYSEIGALVFDSFSGSGTTIIAAENLSRQCRAVEISPAYVAVALQRYQDAFGITPELIG